MSLHSTCNIVLIPIRLRWAIYRRNVCRRICFSASISMEWETTERNGRHMPFHRHHLHRRRWHKFCQHNHIIISRMAKWFLRQERRRPRKWHRWPVVAMKVLRWYGPQSFIRAIWSIWVTVWIWTIRCRRTMTSSIWMSTISAWLISKAIASISKWIRISF